MSIEKRIYQACLSMKINMIKKRNYMQEIEDYVKKNLKKGYTKESLKWALINQGYSKLEVDKAIKRADESLANQAPILKTKPIIKHEIIEPKNLAEQKKSFWQRLFD
jgi:hypothetical protein